jgi:prepilin-type N-terminal cleavage/methylation domain-containing protein
MKNKAFTLIELLAVIVILAVIALIAVPIIMGIIKDARETSNLRSAELYLDAAKLAVTRINIEEELGDTTCTVLEYGNIKCTGKDEEVSVQVNNKEVIKGMGTLVFRDGKLMSVQNLKVGNFYYSMDANGNLVAASYVDFNITKNLTNLTLNGSTTAKTDTTTNVTLVPINGYGLPDTITVTGTTYTYNKQTGVVALTNPTGDVSITATGKVVTYSITKNLTNLTASGATTINTATTATVTLSPSSGYELPDSVTVTGTTYTYNKQTGVISLSNPTSNVTITAIGPERTLKKGDIITMDLDPNTTDETYRVLKVNGTQVEVMSMFDLTTSQKYNETATSNTATFGDITGQKYAGSLLDTYLNTTWYNTLNSTAKAAIVPQNKTQDMWYDNADGDPDYNGTYIKSSGSTTWNQKISKHSGTVAIGNRNVYALSVQDVIDYLEVTSSMTNDNSTLNSSNIWQMFWNTTSAPSGKTTIWLSSAYASYSGFAWYVYYGANLFTNTAKTAYAVRAAFVIDISRVEWNWS